MYTIYGVHVYIYTPIYGVWGDAAACACAHASPGQYHQCAVVGTPTTAHPAPTDGGLGPRASSAAHQTDTETHTDEGGCAQAFTPVRAHTARREMCWTAPDIAQGGPSLPLVLTRQLSDGWRKGVVGVTPWPHCAHAGILWRTPQILI